MKTKTLGRLAAIGLAGLTSVSTMGVAASAFSVNNSVVSGDVYGVTVSTPSAAGVPITTTKWYATEELAKAAAGSGATVTTKPVSSYGSGVTIYVNQATGEVTEQKTGGVVYETYTTATTTTPTPSGSTTTTTGVHIAHPYASSDGYAYQATDGTWYPNYQSLVSDGKILKQQSKVVVDYNYGTGSIYFDTKEGYYVYAANENTVLIKGVSSSYGDSSYDNYDKYDVYKVGGIYYPTLASALKAAGQDYTKLVHIDNHSYPSSKYFDMAHGVYYSSYESALKAAGNNPSLVFVFDNNYYYDDDYYDYYDYYWNKYGYNYGDPYYYYWLQKYKNNEESDPSDTTTATVGKRKGWSSIAKYIKALKNGKIITVDMNEETSIPESVLSAMKGRNVTVKFVLDNGVTFTVNGKDITSAKKVDIDTRYNTNRVSKKLVQAAYKKNKAISTAQISIDTDSFGFEGDITVKFAKKRAGNKAKLYRYNSARESLQPVATAKIQDNGKCTFGEVAKGGDFVIVIY